MSHYEIEPRNRTFRVFNSIIHYEIQTKSKLMFNLQADLNSIVDFNVRIMVGAPATHFCRQTNNLLEQASLDMARWLVIVAGAVVTESFNPTAEGCF